MKKTLLFVSMISMSLMATSQLVITEIMYNPPESGTDSLEYVEIYNNSQSSVDLSNYELHVATSSDVMPSSMLGAGEYKVFSNNNTAFANSYGFSVDELAVSGIGNSGAKIMIKNLTGTTIDSLTYDDKSPWDSLADGEGYSIELCDVNADNTLASNWKASIASISGLVINSKPMFGTPGAFNSVSCSQTNSVIENEKKNISLYPNPVNLGENVILSENVTGVILDITGKQISSIHNSNRISTNDFSKGIYFLNTASYTKRFVVR